MKNINYKSLALALHVLVGLYSFGQQEYQFANSTFNPFILNPAAGGMTDVIHLEMSGRTQWTGYDNGPKTMLLTANSQFKFGKSSSNVLQEYNAKDEKLFKSPQVTTGKSKHVIGGKVWNDAIGVFAKTSVQLSYAYHLPLTKELNFGAGLGIGYSNFRLDESKVVLYQQDDAAYQQFLGTSSQQNLADAQAGIVVYSKQFYFGLSTSQFLKNKVEFDQFTTGGYFSRHYFAMLRYHFSPENNFSFEPVVLLKMTQHSPVSMDLGGRFYLKQATWFGVQYRTGSSLIFQIGSNLIKNIYLSYAFEQSIGKIRTASNGTHELQIGFYLGKNRNIGKELKQNSEGKE